MFLHFKNVATIFEYFEHFYSLSELSWRILESFQLFPSAFFVVHRFKNITLLQKWLSKILKNIVIPPPPLQFWTDTEDEMEPSPINITPVEPRPIRRDRSHTFFSYFQIPHLFSDKTWKISKHYPKFDPPPPPPSPEIVEFHIFCVDKKVWSEWSWWPIWVFHFLAKKYNYIHAIRGDFMFGSWSAVHFCTFMYRT